MKAPIKPLTGKHQMSSSPRSSPKKRKCPLQKPRRGRPPKVHKAEEEFYEVEQIVAKRNEKNGQVKYLIKWLGFPHSENTWQSREDLNCDALLAKFEKEYADNVEAQEDTFPPPITKDGWEDHIETIVGLRECVDEKEQKVLAVKVLWKNRQESEELLDDLMLASPRPVLKFLLTKLKFKTS